MTEHDTTEENTFWPWVTGIAVLALVIWAAAALSSDESTASHDLVVPSAARQAHAQPWMVPDSVISPAAFGAWVRDSAATPERADVDAYARAGLQRLAAALSRPAHRAESDELIARVRALRSGAADSVAGGQGVDPLRSLMEEAVAITSELQGRLGTADTAAHHLAGALTAAAEMDSTEELDRQRHRVYRYFDFMVEALLALSAPI